MEQELIFQYLPIEIPMKGSFGLFTRGCDSVVALVRNSRGQWVLGRKDNFYPEGIVRMVGGGMDDNHPVSDMQRELVEELGVNVDEERLKPLIHAEVTGNLPNGKSITVSIFVFYISIFEPIKAADDLSGLAYLLDSDLHQLIGRYARLPEDVALSQDEPQSCWADYGKVWGPIHQAAFERAKELGL